jgi:outer membrane protein TolC/ABC-type transporter Mla MlaB component
VNKNLHLVVHGMHLLKPHKVESRMLRITSEKKKGKVVLTVEGRLTGPWVGTLEQCWRELRAASPDEKFCLNLCGVSFIDPAGKTLLKEIHRQGGHLVAEGCLNQAIVREINDSGARGKGDSGSDRGEGPKGPPIVFYVAMLSLLLTPGLTRGQAANPHSELPASAPAEVLKLTLDQAVALALKQNTTAQIAILTAAQSVQDKNIARAELLPHADLDVSDSVQRINLEAFLGHKIPGFSQHAGPFQVFQAGPSFGTPVFDLTLFRRFQAARDAANAGKADSLSTREQVILLVVSQYIGTLRNIADVEASQSRVDLAKALYDQAADLQKEGVGTGIDTLRANVELQNENQRLIEAEANRETSLFGLSRLLNLDPRQKIELADALSFFDTPQPDVEASIDTGLATRQEWKSLQEQVRSAEHDKKASSESRLPSMKFQGNWAYTGASSTTGIPTYNYEVSASMPLFTGGRIHAEIVRADLSLQKLHEQQADLRNQIALDVKTALINLDSARNEVKVANLGVQLSNEEVDQARDRFKAGVANNIEVIQAQDSLARANDNQITALYRFNQGRADLARAVGQMEKIYSK